MSDLTENDLAEAAIGFCQEVTWTFAKTMPTNPHWYIVMPNHHDPRLDALKALIREQARTRTWNGHRYRTITLDGWDYWRYAVILNRKPTGLAGWDDEPPVPDTWLPLQYRRDLRGDEELIL